MLTYIHAYTHTCMLTYIHACMLTYIHAYIHAYIHTGWIYAPARGHTWRAYHNGSGMCVYVYVCVRMHAPKLCEYKVTCGGHAGMCIRMHMYVLFVCTYVCTKVYVDTGSHVVGISQLFRYACVYLCM